MQKLTKEDRKRYNRYVEHHNEVVEQANSAAKVECIISFIAGGLAYLYGFEWIGVGLIGVAAIIAIAGFLYNLGSKDNHLHK